jgi:predicted small secreted protein
MISFIKRIGFLLFLGASLAVAGVGCNTARGFGKDVQNAGQGIQNTGHRIEGERAAERDCNHITDQRIEDSRTAERVPEGQENAGEGIQDTGQPIDNGRAAERSYNHITDQRIGDSRTAERVREALAASADYKYEGVKVTACDGVVQLSGFVTTSAQRNSAAEAARKVLGAKSVENKLRVKN